MKGTGKSDRLIVPKKQPNKEGRERTSAEVAEGRGLAKGNLLSQIKLRTLCRAGLHHAAERIRQAARRDRKQRFTSLWHHVYNPDRLREEYFNLKPHAAPGVDGETWEEYGEAALEKVDAVAKLEGMRLSKAAKILREGAEETLRYYYFPREHWRSLRTNNPLERLNKEIRRRTRVVGCFPDSRSALMLVAARLRHVTGTKWGSRRYLNMDRLTHHEMEKESEKDIAA